jgi:peptide/nickel transport system substrate-binding protein
MVRPYRPDAKEAEMNAVRPKVATACLAALLIGTAAGPAAAKTVRIGNQGDVLSMDPHSSAEAVQLSFLGNVFEPLVTRDAQLKLMPALAVRWTLVTPTLWRFELRRNVRFHDGSAFDADERAMSRK